MRVLEATNLSKSYTTAAGTLTVLRDVSLTLAPGDAACVMGPSGSGKSTLLYVLGGLEPPTSGTVRLDGRDPYALSPTELAAYRNREIGFVFQDHCLLPQCTVLENVLVPTLVGEREAGLETRA
ncbi:MAG: ATP-binding cassette domain-containing protein, partial [Vicinamibacterales bacterium]